jgi:signal transduction histidine kinase
MFIKSTAYVASKIQNLKVAGFNIFQWEALNKNHFFLYLSISVALTFWVIESAIHYFIFDEPVFELLPSDTNEMWMRDIIFALIIIFGLFVDFTANQMIAKSKIIALTDNIARAKKQWELVIDSLPQFVIAMDKNARVTRVNRTIEKWGVGKVNKVVGLYVPDFLKCLNDNFADDGWTSDWTYIWQQFKDRDTIKRKIEKEGSGKIYQYSLRKISDYDASIDPCYAVLIIDDITARQILAKSIKDHALTLEKTVTTRTKELRHANSQLENELLAKVATNIQLKQSQDCQHALLREIFTTQEKERKRIAAELHDSIGQSLGAAKFKIEELLLEKIKPADASEYDQLSKLVVLIKNSIHEARHIAMDLRPAMLDDLGILPTLKWFCREFEDTYSQIEIDLSSNADEPSISDNNKVVIFRIVQEALNNIVKHANATTIALDLSKTDSGITLSIRDNGCGFDTNLKPDYDTSKLQCSFGLSSMRERAESTNGKFKIKSSPGSGTYIQVSWGNADA